jgi:hypothetical protein
MSRRKRLRRVVILCQSVARNLAYYRVGWRDEFKSKMDYGLHPASANFFRVANGNFIDILVLEWCKLFAEKRGKHYWENVVADKSGFKAGLLNELGIDEAEFDKSVKALREYRDKFVAHLDSEETMNIPALTIPKKAAWYYYAYIVANETIERDFLGFDSSLDLLHKQMEREAVAAYRRVS